MKICIIAPSLGIGGIERTLSTLANYFSQKKQADVHFVIMYDFNPIYTLVSNIHFYKPIFSHKSTNKFLYYIKLFYFLRSTVKAIKPNVILSFGEIANVIILFSLWGIKIPHFISDRGNPDLKQGGIVVRFFRRILYPHAAGMIAQTDYAASVRRKEFYGYTNISVIPNPCRNLEKLTLERKNWIVYIGRMHYEKGVDRLINAVARIRNFQDWKLVLVGAGLHLDDFKQLAFRLGVTDRVNFVGVSNNVERYLFQSKIFAFPSRGEGFPNALLEAMASGLACVSFDCVAGPRDIIQNHKNGLLIENGDIDAFTKAIELLMSDENLRLAISKEAMLVKQKYSLEKIGDMYYNFLTRNLR